MLLPQSLIIVLIRYLQNCLFAFLCLDMRDSFSKFDLDKLARLTEIYSDDFFYSKKGIKDQLELFIIHVRQLEE